MERKDNFILIQIFLINLEHRPASGKLYTPIFLRNFIFNQINLKHHLLLVKNCVCTGICLINQLVKNIEISNKCNHFLLYMQEKSRSCGIL
jgi:hypothetical protein